MHEYIKSDCYRYTGKSSIWAILRLYITRYWFRWHVHFRMAQSKTPLKFLGRILFYLSPTRKRIQISYKTKIGYGLYIGHGGPIVVSPHTIIGHNCNLSQFVSIGTNFQKGAIIGNDVYIGPNTSVVENVHIGNSSTIGAGSVVVHDVPEGATAAGNYAKVLNYNNQRQFIHNRWNISNH